MDFRGFSEHRETQVAAVTIARGYAFRARHENDVRFRVSECARYSFVLRPPWANELPRKAAFQSARNFTSYDLTQSRVSPVLQ